MLIQDRLKVLFANAEILHHAKEILFKDYLSFIDVEGAKVAVLIFDDVGQKRIELDEVKFVIESIVFQYDHIVGDNEVRVVVRLGDFTSRCGIVTSALGRLILYYNGEPFSNNLYPFSSDCLYML